MSSCYKFYKTNTPLTTEELRGLERIEAGYCNPRVPEDFIDRLEDEKGLVVVDIETETGDEEVERLFLADGYKLL